MGEVADKLGRYSSDPALLRAYLDRLDSLIKSGNLKKYYKLLTDFDFIAAKMNHPEFGVQPLIEDYDLIDDAELFNHPEYQPEKVKALKLIQGALRLSAHILQQDKMQLAGQLLGRMQHFAMPEIQAMLEIAKQRKVSPWLRPLTPSLIPPGGRLLRTFNGHSHSVQAVAVTTDGKKVISGSRDNTLKVWSLETGEELLTFTGHSHWVQAVAVTTDGKKVISGSSDNTLKVWSLETGEQLLTFTGHSDWVQAVAVTTDGKNVISGSYDNTLKVWSLETGEQLLTFTGESSFNCCAVAPDGVTIVAGESSGTVHFLRLEGMGGWGDGEQGSRGAGEQGSRGAGEQGRRNYIGNLTPPKGVNE
ncbi:beta-propeller domain-containing protein [Scytonema sp. HK-05]|uniref:beta-propeller domain-containing protein n=1 Tax=Scytonema sp. HK-05 TaxID=1137095 RepID=UPI000935815B|nr:WD40 repeat domain-containing protein [Scytonema sp. HK-05]OKH52635.1 hypothetical protein NIES2130_31675 [Scytonema sp. HK-05]